jgi:hypothetical protein
MMVKDRLEFGFKFQGLQPSFWVTTKRDAPFAKTCFLYLTKNKRIHTMFREECGRKKREKNCE